MGVRPDKEDPMTTPKSSPRRGTLLAVALAAALGTAVPLAWAEAPAAATRAGVDIAHEEFTLARTLDGYHLAGWLNEISGQAVAAALKAHMGRKGKDDERTPAQRRDSISTRMAA